MERESNPMQPMCRSGCGFYGNPAQDGLCSVCYKDSLRKKQQPPVNSMPVSVPSPQQSPTFSPAITLTNTAQPTVQSLQQQHSEIKDTVTATTTTTTSATTTTVIVNCGGSKQSSTSSSTLARSRRRRRLPTNHQTLKKVVPIFVSPSNNISTVATKSSSFTGLRLLDSAIALMDQKKTPPPSPPPSPPSGSSGSSRSTRKRKIVEENAVKDNAASSSTADPSTSTQQNQQDDKEDDKDAKKKKNRCAECRKKVGLTGFECRCGGLYCAVHRYSDKHDCTFNYREHGAQEIRRNNPVVVGEKIQKI